MKRLHNLPQFTFRRRDLRNNVTPQEIILWAQLKNSKIGYKFRRQHGIGGYIADFYCPEKKLVIEIDGSQHFTKDGQEYDENRTQSFDVLGIKVIRFTNADINTNIDGVIQKIRSEIGYTTPL
jgi:very-short-patch-repair endonuclease